MVDGDVKYDNLEILLKIQSLCSNTKRLIIVWVRHCTIQATLGNHVMMQHL